MLLLESKLDDQGETFYINGNVFYTKNLTLCKTIQLLQRVSGLKLKDFLDCLNINPSQFSYKMRHSFNVTDIAKISKLLGLNSNQIVNLFLRT